MATAALGTSETSDGVWVRNSVLEIALALVYMTINGKIRESPPYVCLFGFSFWSFWAEYVAFFPFRHICRDQRLFLNTYHKIMQAEWRIKVFLEFFSMKSRIYSCITLKYSAAITWMSNLGDTREFIHRDLLVKGTKLLHVYLWSQFTNTIPLSKWPRKNEVIYWSFRSQEWVRVGKRIRDLNFPRRVIFLDAHINRLKCIDFQKQPSYKNEALLRCRKLTTEKIKLTELLVIFNFIVLNSQTSASKQKTNPAISSTAPLERLLHLLFSFSLHKTIVPRPTLEEDGIIKLVYYQLRPWRHF